MVLQQVTVMSYPVQQSNQPHTGQSSSAPHGSVGAAFPSAAPGKAQSGMLSATNPFANISDSSASDVNHGVHGVAVGSLGAGMISQAAWPSAATHPVSDPWPGEEHTGQVFQPIPNGHGVPVKSPPPIGQAHF
jgi:hypothetical protein